MKWKNKGNLYVIAIIITMLFFQSFFLYEKIEANEKRNYINTIEEIIQWKRHSLEISEAEPLLDNKLLNNAGDTTGDWFPVGLGRIGYPDNYESYLAVINSVVSERYESPHKLSESKATEWHRISLAILAMGGDPTRIGLDKNNKPIDLIADGTYNREKDNSLGEQGINAWIWALITLDSMRYKIPEDAETTREDIILEILQQQLNDGGFSLSEETADPDMTGMAITALAPYYNSEETFTYERKSTGKKVERTVREVVDEALNILSEMQLANGAYESMEMENTESIVQVIVALTSLGIDIFSDERFIKNGHTMYDALMNFQMSDGGFVHSNELDEENPSAQPGKSNTMATDQALYALVALYRFEHGYRSLYDFRPELNDKEKNKIDELNKMIMEIDDDKEAILSLFELFKDIPVEERVYVTNYNLLAKKMESLQIENDAKSIVENIGVNDNGAGTIIPIFMESDAMNHEITEEDLQFIEELASINSTEYAIDIVTLLRKLEAAEKNYENEIKKVKEVKVKINNLQEKIDHLNQSIVDTLYPIEQLQIKDEEKVNEIQISYEALNEYDKKKIVNSEDIDQAVTKIKTMKRNKVMTVVFGAIFILSIVLFIYRRKKRVREKKLTHYMND